VTRYSVELTSAAAKQVRKLDAAARARVLRALTGLADEPRPSGVKKLVGTDNAWRIRVGDYRVIYEIDDGIVVVVVFRVAHRRDVYDA
jgi:mRNA interferase RelE/StbE